MNWRRHTLVDVSDAGRKAMLAELAGSGPGSAVLREEFGRVLLPERAGARIPGVVRREEEAPRFGHVPLGFSGAAYRREGRLRIAAFARVADVVSVMSPFEVLSLPNARRTASTAALAAAKVHAESLGLALGVWGSAAIELYTGLHFTREDSDLDLIVAAASLERLACFGDRIKGMEERFGLRIDVEVDLPDGYGVQLKELLNQGRTVLGKGFRDLALLSRAQILAGLMHDPPSVARNAAPYGGP